MSRIHRWWLAVFCFTVLLATRQSAFGQDGCTVLPEWFPGRDIVQVSLDAILDGACGRHDACYRACTANIVGVGTLKAGCDLTFLFETQTGCGDLANQYAQALQDAGISPQDFQAGCSAAMLGVYGLLQTSLGWDAFYSDQCGICSFYYESLGWCDLAAEVCRIPPNLLCPSCSIYEANWCLSAGGNWDSFSCTCSFGRCGEVDPYFLENCLTLGGYFEESLCACWGDGASPVLLDLGGNGLHLTGLETGASFDINADGVKEGVGWTAPGSDDAFLVLDRNGNGWIDDGRELFGNFTSQPLFASANGFLALGLFDRSEMGGNGDGRITPADLIFPHLRLWLDQEGNGVSTAAELSPLAAWGITGIDLDYRESRHRDAHGNVFRYRAKVTFGEHKQSFAYDVFFSQRRASD